MLTNLKTGGWQKIEKRAILCVFRYPPVKGECRLWAVLGLASPYVSGTGRDARDIEITSCATHARHSLHSVNLMRYTLTHLGARCLFFD